MTEAYYRTTFPARQLAEWIGVETFPQREFGLDLINAKTKKEYHTRNLRFDCYQDLVQTLRGNAPVVRVGLGAVFDHRMDREMEFIGREWTFDLDCVDWHCDRCITRAKTMPPDQHPSCAQCCWACKGKPHAICQRCWDGKMAPQLSDLCAVLVHKTDLAPGLTPGCSGGRSGHVWAARPGHRMFHATAGQRAVGLEKIKKLCEGTRVKEFDSDVTNQINHFLRCPFSVNSNSGRVCIPLDPNSQLTDVFALPTDTVRIKDAAALLRPPP